MTATADYDFDLPSELIAQRPEPRRDASRLLVLRRSEGTLEHHRFSDLPRLLNPKDCLVLNDSRVVPARLEGRRSGTGGRWSGLFLELTDGGRWEILSKTRGKLQPGEQLALEPPVEKRHPAAPEFLSLELIERTEHGTWIARPLTDAGWLESLDRYGRVPLPPYIRQGRQQPGDRERYQTVYARQPGSVAAPTAGLHFTERVLADMRQSGIAVASITLHVGWGTFRPITGETLESHRLHAETGELSQASAELINRRQGAGGRVVAVGSTSLRLLENASENASSRLAAWKGETDLYIHPPYRFRIVDALVTNFHLPRTTLLVMVSTFAGKELISKAYQEAIRERYRFYSYGDAMLIL